MSMYVRIAAKSTKNSSDPARPKWSSSVPSAEALVERRPFPLLAPALLAVNRQWDPPIRLRLADLLVEALDKMETGCLQSVMRGNHVCCCPQ